MQNDKFESLYYKAPQDLKSKVTEILAAEEVGYDSKRFTLVWPKLRFAAAVGLVIIAVAAGRLSTSPSLEESLAQEVVSNHVRSLMVGHLMDIASTDRHTVKPWFNGKIDFSPKVVDFASQGYPLVGGRLDYLGSRPVAAMVYQHGKHTINSFTWPATTTGLQKMTFLSRQGYSIFHWVSEGMQYWIISDLNANDLKSFAELVQRP